MAVHDVGSRVIVAIKLDAQADTWCEGPPFAVLQSVFDENDLLGCAGTEADLD